MPARTERRHWLRATAFLGPILGLIVQSTCAAGELQADAGAPSAAGKAMSPKGSLLVREAVGQPWRAIAEGNTVRTGELVLGLPGAMLDSANGAARLTFLTDLAGRSPFPVVECAVSLNPPGDRDLDFTLDRGRLDVTNRKSQGPAHVRLRVRQKVWDLTLQEPGTRVALELYGRWAPGTNFTKTPGPKDVPTADLVVLVIQGQISLKHEAFEHALHAPPGPAMTEWDSLTGHDETPRRLEKLPEWASPAATTPDIAARKARLDRFRQALAEHPIGDVVDRLLQSDDAGDRRLAVLAMGATDDLQRLGQALREAKHLDVWDEGVLALRHWISRSPGNDQILYRRLVEDRKFTPVTAESILQLLHSFSATDLAHPATYETLIEYLSSEHLPLRGLAYWHLSRLVPAGKEFGYNPLAPEAARTAAIQKWKMLIPAGKMPPRPKVGGGK